MRAQQIEVLEGPDGLRPVEVADPDGDARVLIDVVAAGVSFPDLLMSRGLYQTKPPVPFIPGVEVAGRVRSAPEKSGFAPGERVMAVTILGGFAERVAAEPSMTVRMPEQLSFEQAAGFIMNYHTAHFALVRRGRLLSGETVAVQGAAGGMGSASVQVARGVGARVVALVSSDEKAEVARRAGASDVVDVRGSWAESVRSLTAGRGADVIIDPVGGDRFDESLRCLAPEGRLIVVGFAEGRIPSVPANRVLFRNIDIVGAAWGAFLAVDPSLFSATQDALNPIIAAGSVSPIVSTTFPLERAADALRALDERRALGKLVLTV
ncbi:MAG: NADPH:quinone oxidoreductase family protein [Candidatus Dormibacteraeota bacterium]|nr:NADPH:quinone oxidoreductase family protein [Candidatus Dormibacteraeota bacterium]